MNSHNIHIHIIGGTGGNGCIHFKRGKHNSKGGADGGNGGNGGSVIITTKKSITEISQTFTHTIVSKSLKIISQNSTQQNLSTHMTSKSHHTTVFKAQNGFNGLSAHKKGKDGATLHILVPIGTQIWNDTGEILLAELLEENEQYLLAKGGKGGFGNKHFTRPDYQAPYKYTYGIQGESFQFLLIFKKMADVGLIGLPNSGKSTFLSKISNAKPKIANHPFSSTTPVIGSISVQNNQITFIDLPSLCKNSHQGKGLGNQFLKHAERCKILLHFVDISSENIFQNIDIINNELLKYSATMLKITNIIILSKTDQFSQTHVSNIKSKLYSKYSINLIFESSEMHLIVNFIYDMLYL